MSNERIGSYNFCVYLVETKITYKVDNYPSCPRQGLPNHRTIFIFAKETKDGEKAGDN